ncbi:hypothetical protein C2S53_020261 [Perilla frutescens var. hirtella]|uniref:Cytochrome P450 n=1 Tax=Perilla frutescens var. hirtella TaxID=608512 RepID=A0AAD4JHZ1_PERFH|nr:hypothetical protein C2S53_020261 [Perilla frutescens var. hirtella]
MDEIFPILASLILLWCICRSWYHKRNGMKNPPPSPPSLPLIGNLHQLGSLPHQNLHIMARKHGPIMLLHFGSLPVLVISSADAAREITITHDLTFASRPVRKRSMKISYNGKDVVFAPYGEDWRRGKSIFVLKLLSKKRVQSYQSIREEETALLVKSIQECSGRVNLSAMFIEFTNDVVCRSAFGRKYSTSEKGKRFLELVGELSESVGSFSVGEFISWLSWVDRARGFDQKFNSDAQELDEFLDAVIQERIENQEEISGENFLDILLEISKDDVSVDRDGIKAILMDAFAAGTDTSSTFLEWAMTELLRHPAVMEKLQTEVREIAEENREITEFDLERMHYMKAVIKEVFRLHPPLALIIPRVALRDVEIKGYDISAGTLVLLNEWAISRDPVSWDEPEEFKPERFLNSLIDFKGLSFELLPFGAGRRVCPGMTFAVATIEFLLATLVQKFNWKLPDGVEGKDLDMTEIQGITVHRKVPLLALASTSLSK